jgi:hypothetical protein
LSIGITPVGPFVYQCIHEWRHSSPHPRTAQQKVM